MVWRFTALLVLLTAWTAEGKEWCDAATDHNMCKWKESGGFIEEFDDLLRKIRSHPLASPLGEALAKTTDIVDQIGLGPVGSIIKGALWVVVKVLHPDALGSTKSVHPDVFQHLEEIEDKLADVHKLAEATLRLQLNEWFKSGLEQIDGAYTTLIKSASNMDQIMASMEANILPFQTNAETSFKISKIKEYLKHVKEFHWMDSISSVNAVFNYVINIRAKYLLMMTQFYLFKKNTDRIIQEFQDFNKFFEEVIPIYMDINDVAAALEKALKSGGEEAVRKMTEKHLNQWKFQKVNFAVTGESGAGKSSFINTIRGMRALDPRAAKTDVNECTNEVAMYDFPENPNIKIWDLPGVGTKSFPRDKYFEMMDSQLGKMQEGLTFDSFDAHMVFSASRFTENDHFIADRVNSLGKKLIYGRTKIDQDVDNNEERDISEEETLKSIRKACEDNLKEVKNKELFLISTKLTKKLDYRNKWDFQRLYKHIFETLSDVQKEAFLLSIQAVNEEMIRQKVQVLKERIYWRHAAWWATVGPSVVVGSPLGLLSLPFEAAGGLAWAAGLGGDLTRKTRDTVIQTLDKLPYTTILYNEVLFQREQLSIDDKSIENLARDAGKTKQEIMKEIDLYTGPRNWRLADLYKELDRNEESAKKKMHILNKLHKKKM